MTWNFNDPLKTPSARVRGMGSAKDGTNHWWMQRLTALILVPLILWFVASLMHLAVNGGQSIGYWFSNPVHALLAGIMLCAMFYHAKLGMQVILEDYVHCHILKTAFIILNSFIFYAAGVASILAVAKIHFSSVTKII